MFDRSILSDNWLENLVLFYFVGMVLSRIGSLIIEPIMKTDKIINGKPKTAICFLLMDYEKCAKRIH